MFFYSIAAASSTVHCITLCFIFSQCEGDLKCFQRDGLTPVPGCDGTGLSSHDYCYMADAAGLILHYPVEDCAGSSATDSLWCYDMTHHLVDPSGWSLPTTTDHYVRLGVDFETCGVLCERLANYASNVDNPYRGVDVDMNWNRCYCLFDDQPTCPQFLPSSCSAYPGDGSGPVSHSRGDPETYPYPVVRTQKPTQLWDGTVSADSGVCVFIAGHQRSVFGGSLLTSLGWIYLGEPAGFGYPNQLSLYCQYNVASAELPPFHDFTVGNPDATWGIHHGFCTFGDMYGVPFVSNSAELAYDPVEIPFIDPSSNSQAIPLEDFGATPAGEHLPLSRCQGDCDRDR